MFLRPCTRLHHFPRITFSNILGAHRQTKSSSFTKCSHSASGKSQLDTTFLYRSYNWICRMKWYSANYFSQKSTIQLRKCKGTFTFFCSHVEGNCRGSKSFIILFPLLAHMKAFVLAFPWKHNTDYISARTKIPFTDLAFAFPASPSLFFQPMASTEQIQISDHVVILKVGPHVKEQRWSTKILHFGIETVIGPEIMSRSKSSCISQKKV